MEKQIIAMGNGSFKSYLLEQCPKEKPKICLLPQASGDFQWFVTGFFTQFLKLNTEPSYLSVIYPEAQVTDIEDFLCSQDIIYVTGGNTKTLMGIWKEWEIDKHLKTAYEAGVILSGFSAGAICWFEQALTDSFPGVRLPVNTLGFLEGSCAAHYDSDPLRRPAFHQLLKEGKMIAGYGLDDGAAIHYVDGEVKQVLRTQEGAGVYRVVLEGEDVVEEKLDSKWLG